MQHQIIKMQCSLNYFTENQNFLIYTFYHCSRIIGIGFLKQPLEQTAQLKDLPFLQKTSLHFWNNLFFIPAAN